MVRRSPRNAAALGAVLATVLAPAAARADRPGEQVGGRRAVTQTTVELNADTLGRLPVREQPEEHEPTPPPKSPNPDAPPNADGGPARPRARLRATTVTSGLDFKGPTLADAGAYPPDSQGDVGPTQYVVMINGRVRSYSKATGAADGVLDVDSDVFWRSAMTPVTGSVTSNFTSDPHIRYDRLSGRWIAVMIDVPNNGDRANRIMVAVSSGGTITASTTWRFFSFDAPAGEFADYPTLGVDANALYIGTNEFSASTGGFLNTNAYVVQKSSVLGTGTIKVTAFRNLLTSSSGTGPFTPQGVDNPSASSATGYFVGADNAQLSRLDIRAVTDPGGASPTLSGNLALTVPATAYPVNVPQSGGAGQSATLDALDDRLFAAQIRDGHLWTAHNIGVNSSGAAATNNRTGSRWYEIALSPNVSLVQSGTVFDSALSAPRSYWIPSLAVNGQGNMVLAGSVSSAQTLPNAWFAGRKPGDGAGTVSAPVQYSSTPAGVTTYKPSNNRWGDYSLTSVDPSDDQTVWTIQEYISASNQWGTRIAKVLAPAPLAPTGATPSRVMGGQSDVAVDLSGPSGAGWFDPGAGFARRLAVSVGCGIVAKSVTYSGPASLTVHLDATDATRGACDVTVTNPDGQSATATGLLTTNSPPVANPDTYTADSDSTLNGTSVLANDTDADADALTATLVGDVSHGTLALAADGTFTYTPTAGFSGVDSFTYRAGDGAEESDAALVRINVVDAVGNRAPAGVADAYAVPHSGTLVVTSGVLGNDSDPDGQFLTATKLTDPQHGTLTFAPDGTFTYVADPGHTGGDSFTYAADDGVLASAPVTVSLTGPADAAPVANADSYEVPAAGALDGTTVLANDTDADGDPLTASKTASPAHGTVALAPDGTFHYQASAGFSGTDTFSYLAGDGRLASAPATVTLTVAAAPTPSTGGGGGGGGGDSGGGSAGESTDTAALPVLTPPSLTSGTVVPISAAAPAPPATPTQAPAPRCHVPRLRGHSVRYARSRLTAAHCAVGSIRRVKVRGVKRGRVARTLPRAGSVLAAGSRVALRTAR